MKRIIACLVALIALVPQAGHARAGDIDYTFGRYGFSFADFRSWDTLTALSLASDGKIVAGGWTYGGSTPDFAVARFTSKGALDKTFGGKGTAKTSFGLDDKVIDVAGAPGGKVVAAGNSVRQGFANGEFYSESDFAVARFTSKGALDKTFSGDGKLTTDFFGNKSEGEFVSALVVQADAKIIVGGNTAMQTRVESPLGTYEDHSRLILLSRYLDDGTADPTFGAGGKVVLDLGSPSELAELTLLKDGSIVLGGTLWTSGENPESDAFVMKLTTVGTPDPTFGIGGRALVDFGGPSDRVNAMTIGKDGKIVLAGVTTRRFELQLAVARLSAAGTLDTTFSGDGKFATKVKGGGNTVNAIAAQSDGKILVSTTAFVCRVFNFGGVKYKQCFPGAALARFTKAGAFDKTFGSGGTVIPNLPIFGIFDASSPVHAMVLQGDKAILGGAFGGTYGQDFGVTRLMK